MICAYARVSTTEQNVDRQLNEFKKYQIDKIYIEKQSAKNFHSRKVYQAMKKALRAGDLLYIMSIDRFGRNYQEILDEWRFLTEKKNIDICVLDMPILNTRNGVDGLDGKFITNLVLQILAYVSQKEREKIKERQYQGIQAAKEKGVRFGRPRSVLPDNANEIIQDYLTRKINAQEAKKLLGISHGTFYRLLRPDEKLPKYIYRIYTKDGEEITFKSVSHIAKYFYVSTSTILNIIKGKNTCLDDKIDRIERTQV